ncbi:MAG TPA: hypothetical protein PKJ24_03250 [Prolixibacteraceae bacterium]|nr:hypothetical protein [Prolixibacteraceae bacterium]HPT31138.1 hypothetical protein [Prolixibacteraceae bacterium]
MSNHQPGEENHEGQQKSPLSRQDFLRMAGWNKSPDVTSSRTYGRRNN